MPFESAPGTPSSFVNGVRLARSHVIGWDTETHLITPTDKAPPLVCLSLAGDADTFRLAGEAVDPWDVQDVLFRVKPNGDWALLASRAAAPALWVALAHAAVHHKGALTAHNAPYDLTVLLRREPALWPVVLKGLRDGWLSDTRPREQLWGIATDNFVYDRRLGLKRSSGDEDEGEGAGFSLAEVVQARFGVDLSAFKSGPDVWRLRYAELEDVPLDEWPEEAIAYALSDAEWARDCYKDQATPLSLLEGVVVDNDGVLVDERRQVCADFALTLMSNHGADVDPDAVQVFIKNVAEEAEKSDAMSLELGWRVINKCKQCLGTGWMGYPPHLERCVVCAGDPTFYPKGCRGPLPEEKHSNLTARKVAWVEYAYGGAPPKTKVFINDKGIPAGGNVKTDAETFEFSGNERLAAYAGTLAAVKLRNTYTPILLQAMETRKIHARFNVLVRSGRTSCAKPNMQNPPKIGGFRECFLAPPGMVFASLDYAALEMTTLAQTCIDLFGFSVLGDKINAGLDPHLWFAVNYLMPSAGVNVTYDEAKAIRKNEAHPLYKQVKHWRNVAKVCDFGYPGGLGANTFVGYARGYGLTVLPDESARWKDAFLAAWTCVKKYLKEYIGGLSNKAGTDAYGDNKKFAVRLPQTGFIRGDCYYTSAANTGFQGPAAAGLKTASFDVIERQYTRPESALYGVRTWNAIHDELLLVGPESTAHEWAHEAADVMVAAMRQVTPDIVQKVEPAIMYRWSKEAEPVYLNGRLVAWTPPEKEAA